MNAVAHLHEHRKAALLYLAPEMERVRKNARAILAEPDSYRDDTVAEVCDWLRLHGSDTDRQAAAEQLFRMRVRERRVVMHRAAPPGVEAVKTQIKLDALAVIFSAAFALGAFLYVVTL